MGKTNIEWADAVWNPVTGCTPISEGCANCYAKRMAETRLRGRHGYPADEPFRVTFHEERLFEPHEWKTSRRIFVCSMGDLFHEDVPFEFIRKIVMSMLRPAHASKWHTFIVLTKRPERMKAFFEWLNAPEREFFIEWPQKHIWLGITAENQKRLEERWPYLRGTPAAKRLISFEPALGMVNFEPYFRQWECPECGEWNDSSSFCSHCDKEQWEHLDNAQMSGIDWIIAGGETGPNARPSHPNWLRKVRDGCDQAGVPFFFKQWGEWAPTYAKRPPKMRICRGGEIEALEYSPDTLPKRMFEMFGTEWVVGKSGKKTNGRLLDGREYLEVPT